VRYEVAASRSCLQDGFGGQERALDLNEVHVRRRFDAGIGHGRLDCGLDHRAMVPSSSGRRRRVLAMPATNPVRPRPGPTTSRLTNTVTWGVRTPSVPPDMMNCARASTSDRVTPSRAASSAV
jgi:hypothetical protein